MCQLRTNFYLSVSREADPDVRASLIELLNDKNYSYDYFKGGPYNTDKIDLADCLIIVPPANTIENTCTFNVGRGIYEEMMYALQNDLDVLVYNSYWQAFEELDAEDLLQISPQEWGQLKTGGDSRDLETLIEIMDYPETVMFDVPSTPEESYNIATDNLFEPRRIEKQIGVIAACMRKSNQVYPHASSELTSEGIRTNRHLSDGFKSMKKSKLHLGCRRRYL